MLAEVKKIFENIKHFRKLLTEGVGSSDIVDAINNREYIYIYYAGDETIEKGSRTIRPFVLGTHKKSGNLVLRAWQDKGRSDSLRSDSPRKRRDHEYHTDNDGKEKPGWRLFRVDGIVHIYPTGRRFIDSNGNVMIPPLYNENDNDMSSIVASISVETPSRLPQKNVDAVDKPTVSTEKISPSEFEGQSGRFKRFFNAASKKRDLTKRDVENLYNVAKRVMKKSPNRYLVAVDNVGNFHLVDVKNTDKLPPESIVGTLTNLYGKYATPASTINPEAEKIIKQSYDKMKKE